MADRDPAILLAALLFAWFACLYYGYRNPPRCPDDPTCATDGLPMPPNAFAYYNPSTRGD